ncbi:MAG TPA: hypothetical protein VHQ22_04575 [Terriglobales bacterium]|jgi:hypothetical protein|nr:hypothetical protein [Terriglobales bacterium]
MDSVTMRESFTDAIRFWEPRRLIYNLALGLVVIVYFVVGYPASKATLSADFALLIFLLAVIANVAYCAAYLVDIFVQASGYREIWQRSRWLLFAVGTAFAAIITRFVAMGMFHLEN